MSSKTFDLPVPLESEEQFTFVEWLDLLGLRYTSIPNSTYSPYMNQKIKNKRQGLRAGLPDLLVLVPTHRSKDGLGHVLFIEMKRRKGGVVSPDQAKWIGALNGLESDNVHATVAKGAEEAMLYVNKFLTPEPLSVF